jgi:hypothetical protein
MTDVERIATALNVKNHAVAQGKTVRQRLGRLPNSLLKCLARLCEQLEDAECERDHAERALAKIPAVYRDYYEENVRRKRDGFEPFRKDPRKCCNFYGG